MEIKKLLERNAAALALSVVAPSSNAPSGRPPHPNNNNNNGHPPFLMRSANHNSGVNDLKERGDLSPARSHPSPG
jgi:hypothetical protein